MTTAAPEVRAEGEPAGRVELSSGASSALVNEGKVDLPPAAPEAAKAKAAPEAAPDTPHGISFEGGSGVYLSPAGGAATITVFLHGMCANGGLECPVFAGASRAGWLLCPDGGISCGGGGWMWSLPPRQAEARIEAAVAALKAAQPGEVGEGPRAIVGYSLGAPSALVQAMMGKGRYDRLMIVNASVEPAPPAMKEAGVRRVALVAGERDATAQKLQAAAARLKRAGVEARYFALQKTGHYFDGTSRERMDEPLEWLLAPLEAPARLPQGARGSSSAARNACGLRPAACGLLQR